MLAKLLQQVVRVYQLAISPLLGPRCRFYPSCSQYFADCLDKYSLPTALAKTSRRLLSCHPGNPGGVDFP